MIAFTLDLRPGKAFATLDGPQSRTRRPRAILPLVLYSLLYVMVRFLLEVLIVQGRSEARLRAEVLALRHHECARSPKAGSAWPASAPTPGTRPAATAVRDPGGGRKRTSADGPARGASPRSWPAAPGAGRSPEAGGRVQPGSCDRLSASEAVERCVAGRAAPGGGRGVRDRDRQPGDPG